MSRAWGRAASALGQGILQMGAQSQREKLEAQRAANMERLRMENQQIQLDNRAYQEERLAENRAYQEGIRQSDRDFQSEQAELNRKSAEKRLDSGKNNQKIKFVMDNYKALTKEAGSLFDQINHVQTSGDYSAEEVRQHVSDLHAKIKAIDEQRKSIHDLNPEIASVIGTSKKPEFIDRKAESSMLDEAEKETLGENQPTIPTDGNKNGIVQPSRKIIEDAGIEVEDSSSEKLGKWWDGVKGSVNKHSDQVKAQNEKVFQESILQSVGTKLKGGGKLTEAEWMQLAKVNPYRLQSFGLSEQHLKIIQQLSQG